MRNRSIKVRRVSISRPQKGKWMHHFVCIQTAVETAGQPAEREQKPMATWHSIETRLLYAHVGAPETIDLLNQVISLSRF